MKKFIKDWWPLLLIAGWLLWKRHEKRKWLCYGQPSNNDLTATIAKQLVDRGFEKTSETCSVCGSEVYAKFSYSPTDLTQGTQSANYTETCSNPKCSNCQFPQWATENF